MVIAHILHSIWEIIAQSPLLIKGEWFDKEWLQHNGLGSPDVTSSVGEGIFDEYRVDGGTEVFGNSSTEGIYTLRNASVRLFT